MSSTHFAFLRTLLLSTRDDTSCRRNVKRDRRLLSARSPKNIKTEKLQKALISGSIINVKYSSFRVILVDIECA